MADSKHQVPLHELAVDYITDKIPPGWFVGCKLSLKKYMELAEDWKKMKGLNDDMSAQVAACRFRLKGPARELVDANRELKKGADGHVLEAYNNDLRRSFDLARKLLLQHACFAWGFRVIEKAQNGICSALQAAQRRFHSGAHPAVPRGRTCF